MGLFARDGRRESESGKSRPLEVWILFTSSLFWSWSATVVLQPTLFFRFPEGTDGYTLFCAIVIVTCTVVFLSYWIAGERLYPLLDRKRWELVFVCGASLGNALVIMSPALGIDAFVIAGALLTGLGFPYFLLEWCRMYARRSASSAAQLASGAIGLSFALDLLISALDPSIRAWFAVSMPLLIAAMLYGVRGLTNFSPDKPQSESFSSDEAFGAAAVFTTALENDPASRAFSGGGSGNEAVLAGPHPSSSSLQVKYLAASAVIGGVTIGLAMNGRYASSAITAAAFAAYAIASFLMFFLLHLRGGFLKRFLYELFFVVGAVGALLAGSSEIAMASDICIGIGFLAYAVGLIFLCAYYSRSKGGDDDTAKLSLFSCNLFLLFAGIIGGSALWLALSGGALLQDASMVEHLVSVVFMLATIMLFANAASLPLPLFEGGSGASGPADSAPVRPQDIAHAIAGRHGLTEREAEVLTYLLMGRSRPRIAEMLCLSENTVNSHIQHIYRKVHVHSFQELLDFVYRDGGR